MANNNDLSVKSVHLQWLPGTSSEIARTQNLGQGQHVAACPRLVTGERPYVFAPMNG